MFASEVPVQLGEAGNHMTASTGNFDLNILVHFHESLETSHKESFMPPRLQKLPVPIFTHSVFESSPPSEWSPSPATEESQTPPDSSSECMMSADRSCPTYEETPRVVPPESPYGQTVEVHNTDTQFSGSFSQYAPPNSAPLLDSRVYVFYTPSSGPDELDFACIGHSRRSRRDALSNEGRTLGPVRDRAWSSPGRPQSALPHAKSRITSGSIIGREKKPQTRGSPEPTRADGNTGLKYSTLDKAASIKERNEVVARVSNKWGQHPPAGYF